MVLGLSWETFCIAQGQSYNTGMPVYMPEDFPNEMSHVSCRDRKTPSGHSAVKIGLFVQYQDFFFLFHLFSVQSRSKSEPK